MFSVVLTVPGTVKALQAALCFSFHLRRRMNLGKK